MVPDIGSVVLLENGKIGIVHSFMYKIDTDNYLTKMDEFINATKIGLEGIDFDGHYWSSNNLNLKVLAVSLDEYNKKTTFYHPV